MLLSALAVIYISTPETYAATEAALANTYYVVQSDIETDTNAQQLGNSLVNALVIVSVICGLTFFIVILYKYNCTKCLTGYMVLAMGLLLGYLAAVMFQVFLERYTIYLDKVTFILIMYNFALVGVISIFLGGPASPIRIVPVYMNQIYLVIVSVIVAWQLSHFDPWTAWVLLVLLAFYDLFAVLTPCGPLKALVNLMHRENAPDMPGLLYEASLSNNNNSNNNYNTNNNNNRQRRRQQQQQRRQPQQQSSNNANANDNNRTTDTSPMVQSEQHQTHNSSGSDSNNSTPIPPHTFESSATTVTRTTTPTNAMTPQTVTTIAHNIDNANVHNTCNIDNEAAVGGTVYDVDTGEPSSLYYTTTTTSDANEVAQQPLIHTANHTALIPLALAKLYKLPYRFDPQPPWITPRGRHNPPDNTATIGAESIVYTPAQLHELVEVVFHHGGRIVPTISLDTPAAELYRRTQLEDQYQTRYTVIDAHGVHKRVLFVNEVDGRVFEDLREENMRNERRERVRNSIKLGLGDFIFYSILVSKAALYSYTTFVVCTLAVLSGLGMTLLLLAMYGQALPALPISILLGVIFYVITRFCIEPAIEAMYLSRVYA